MGVTLPQPVSPAPVSMAPVRPVSTPAAGANGVPVPVGEVFAVATEYVEAGRLDAAERMLGHILSVAPQQSEALHLKGLIAFRRGNTDVAATLMERSIAEGGVKAAHFRNLSEVYRLQARLDQALAAARRAVALDPADPLGPFNLAMVHYDRLEIEPCIAAARHSLDLRQNLPQSHMKLAQAMLLSEDFAQGWEEYEWRYQIPGAQPLMPPGMERPERVKWDGKPLEGPGEGGRRLLLIADQGFGDVVMFARYIPWAMAICPDLVVACSSEMISILSSMVPGLRLFNRWDEIPPYAAYCAFSGLPRLHGTRIGNVPATVPYLRAAPERAQLWRQRLDAQIAPGLKRVGIAWAGRPTHNNDLNRSIKLETLAPLFDIEGMALVSLQKGPAVEQIAGYKGRAPLIDLDKQITEFDDTVAILDGLDLLICVDTAVGHFAGAMGRPVWVMLPHAPDWRWLMGRRDTPWYPTMRFFRHPAPRRWDMVVPAVAGELRRFLG